MLLPLARALSILGHPALLIPVAVASSASARMASAMQVRDAVLVCVLIAVVTMAFSVYKVRRGLWGHVDASSAAERRELNVFLALLLLSAAGVLHWLGQPRTVVMGLGLSGVMVVVALAARGCLKISLHAAFAVYAAGIAWPALWMSAAIALLAIGVAWSRVVLQRHTLAEVLVGAALGAAAAGVLHWVVRF
jgi:membrane-associated phospholipid phosphatase